MKRLIALLTASLLAPTAIQAQPISAAELSQVPPNLATPAAGCPVALTVSRARLLAAGGPALITYDHETQGSPAWLASSTLVVPRECGGRYLLSVNQTKSVMAGDCQAGATGTNDDAHVIIRRKPLGGAMVTLGPNTGAWGGARTGVRPSGGYTVVVVLNEGDQINTWSHAGADRTRCHRDITFSAATLR
jgi:hypothetical protein